MVRGQLANKGKGKSFGTRLKLRGSSKPRYKSPCLTMRRCWKCGKVGHHKRECNSMEIKRIKGFEEILSNNIKPL